MIDILRHECREYASKTTVRMPTDWVKELGKKAQGYWGDPVFTAEPITLKQVTCSLPGKVVAGTVKAVAVLDGQIRDQLRDPEALVLPREQWPDPMPTASTQLLNPSEWPALALELWERGLCLWLPKEALFSPSGRPLLNGLFAVPKDKPVPGHPELHVQRLI